MSAKEKQKFEDMAKTDKVRYDREMKNYVPPKGAKGGKRKKDPNAPKRPPYVDHSHNYLLTHSLTSVYLILTFNVCFVRRSAFFIFCSDHRSKIKNDNPGISIGDIAKKLGVMWSNVTPKEKTPYEQKAMKLKEKYEKVRLLHSHLSKSSSFPSPWVTV